MAHTLILGRTETGKTTLGKAIVRQAEARGLQAIVLDPMKSKGWGKKTELVSTSEKLLERAMQTKSKLLVVDESSLSLNKFDRTLSWLSKTSRHLGHSAIFIAHNLHDVAKGIRTQCTQIFIFASSRSDVRDLDDEFDAPEILKATKLEQFHFFRIVSNNQIQKGRVYPVTFDIVMLDSPTPNEDRPEKISDKKLDKPTVDSHT